MSADELKEERRKVAMDRFFALVDETQEQNKQVPFEEIEAAIDEAVREVRAERRKKESST